MIWLTVHNQSAIQQKLRFPHTLVGYENGSRSCPAGDYCYLTRKSARASSCEPEPIEHQTSPICMLQLSPKGITPLVRVLMNHDILSTTQSYDNEGWPNDHALSASSSYLNRSTISSCTTRWRGLLLPGRPFDLHICFCHVY
uniref:Uncharacterized protein n=1 Tax=Agaricus bisporus TaxID=5341 RepID=A0A1Q1M942_AGABI|nr:hypothetical protein [Agaricus bisporus]